MNKCGKKYAESTFRSAMRDPAALSDALRTQLGIGVRTEWVQEALSSAFFLNQAGQSSWNQERVLQELFGQMLMADLNVVGHGILPPGVQVGWTLARPCAPCKPMRMA
jgi:hypothetical protein